MRVMPARHRSPAGPTATFATALDAPRAWSAPVKIMTAAAGIRR